MIRVSALSALIAGELLPLSGFPCIFRLHQ